MNENDSKYVKKPTTMDLLLGGQFLNVTPPDPLPALPEGPLPFPDAPAAAASRQPADLSAAPSALAQAVSASVDPVHAAPRVLKLARVPLGLFPKPLPEKDNPAALFCGGWLRKGGGAFIVAPSGVGKSVMTIQCAICWALGKPFFGVAPVRPLRIEIIQAEDDNNEIAFFRDKITEGLVNDFGFDEMEIEHVLGTPDCPESARVRMSKAVALTGQAFVEEIAELLRVDPLIDLVMVNPFQSYFGADCSKNVELSTFFRNWLDSAIKHPDDFGVDRAAVMFIHHTNKPPSDKDEREGWGVDMFAQYIGAGGAEIVNWSRAILSLMPTKIRGCFRLCAGKRGQRLGWEDVATGKPTFTKILKHADSGSIYWKPASPEDEAELSAKPAGKGGAVGGDGSGGVPPVPVKKGDLISTVNAVNQEPGMSENHYRLKIAATVPCSSPTARGLLLEALSEGLLCVKVVGKSKRYEVTAEGLAVLAKVDF
ncbi:MAG: AAA family ATPase [bacterium]